MTIRAERPADYGATRRVHEQAFGADSSEADLVDALRASGSQIAELCLVAEDGDQIIGHIVFSRGQLASGDEVLALAPMAVLPDHQRSGTGSRLIEEALRRAAQTNFSMVVVVGHPTYYPRFGFEPAHEYGVIAPWEIPAEAWMVHRLPAYRPQARGLVAYPSAFDLVT